MKTQKNSLLVSVATLFLLLIVAAHQEVVKAEPADSGPNNGADVPSYDTSYQTLVSCPFRASGGGDNLSRGFYVQNYPGTNLGSVQIAYWTDVAGSYAISMTARDGTYDGPMIGATRIVTVDLPASTYITTTFDFGGAFVTSGTTVTFLQGKVSGPGPAYYNTGPCGFDLDCTICPGVYQTEDSMPPLDIIRRRSVAVTVVQVEQTWLYLPLVMTD